MTKFLKIRKKAGQAEIKSDGRTGLKGMIASGRQTAPPQYRSEVVSVTNSACQARCEAAPVFPIAIESNGLVSPPRLSQEQVVLRLHSVYTASRSPILSDPPGRGA